MIFLYPSYPDTKIVDEDYQAEYKYIKNNPDLGIALLVDTEYLSELSNGYENKEAIQMFSKKNKKNFLMIEKYMLENNLYEEEEINNNQKTLIPIQNRTHIDLKSSIVYRGWMLSREEINIFILSFNENSGSIFHSTIIEFFKTHYICNWYSKISTYTFNTEIFRGSNCLESFNDSNFDFQDKKYIVKDFVKSFQDSNGVGIASNKEEVNNICENILKYKSEIEGGLVLREYEELDVDSERRYYILNNKVYGSDLSSDYPFILDIVVEKINITSLYAIDIVQTVSGEWKVVEIDNGQVTGLKEWGVEEFYTMFFDNI